MKIKNFSLIILMILISFTTLYAKTPTLEESFLLNSLKSLNENCFSPNQQNSIGDFANSIKQEVNVEVGSISLNYRKYGKDCVPIYSIFLNDENIKYVESKSLFKLKKIKNGFSVDPLSLDNEVHIIYKANGGVLLKCSDWDFNNNKCLGNWKPYLNTEKGRSYLITVKGKDPAFLELLPSKAYDSNRNDVTLEVSYNDNLRASSSFLQTSFSVNATFDPNFSQSQQIGSSNVSCTVYALSSSSNSLIRMGYFNYTDSTWYDICTKTITLTTKPTTYSCNATSFFNINKSKFTFKCDIAVGTYFFFPPIIYVDRLGLGVESNSTNSCGYLSSPGYYTLNKNITNTSASCFIINSPNTTLDCNGNTIGGNNVGAGVYVVNQPNITIKNCKIENYPYGIYAFFSTYDPQNNKINLENTALKNNVYGFYGNFVLNSSLKNISFENNTVGLYVNVFDNSSLINLSFINNSRADLWLNWTWDTNISNVVIEGGESSLQSLIFADDSRRISIDNLSVYGKNNVLNISGVSQNIEFKDFSIWEKIGGTRALWDYVVSNDSLLTNTTFYISSSSIALDSVAAPYFNKSTNLTFVNGSCSRVFFSYGSFSNDESTIISSGFPYEITGECVDNKIITTIPSFSSYTITNLNSCAYLGISNTIYNITTNIVGNKIDSTCLTVINKNISIEGNNFALLGNSPSTTMGINIISQDNINISNLSIMNYTYGINIFNSTNVSIYNVSISNTTYAINSYRIYDKNNPTNIKINNSHLYLSTYSITFTNTSNSSLDKLRINDIYSTSSIIYGTNITLSNSIFSNITNLYAYALYFSNSTFKSINNNFSRVYYGLGGEESSFEIKNNRFLNYNESAVIVKNSNNSNISNNLINNSLIYGSYSIYLLNSNSIKISNNSISNTYYGIYGSNSNNSSIYSNEFRFTNADWHSAVYFTDSVNTTIENNTFNRTYYGVRMNNGEGTIARNIFDSLNNSALVLENSVMRIRVYDNKIKNTLISSASSIYLSSQNNSLFYSNIVESNSNGISLFSSSGNIFYNNIINTTSTNVYDETSLNYWNATYNCSTKNIIGGNCIGGNYYSDYYGYDGDGDGIGESSYTIYGSLTNTYDYLPLTNNVSIRKCFNAYGGIYSIEDNIYGNKSNGACITIEKNNTVVRCNGFNITGSSNLESSNTIGIYVNGAYINISIIDCNLKNYSVGIDLITADNISIENTSISGYGGEGISITNGEGIRVINNIITNASIISSSDVDYGITISGVGSKNILIENNIINDTSVGISTTTSPSKITIKDNTIFNVKNALLILGDEFSLTNNKLYSCSSYCISSDSSASNLNISDFIYSSNNLLNLSGTLNVILKGFSVGFNSLYGIINWSFVNLSIANILLEQTETINLQKDFVGLNSSNSKVSQLNSSVNISLFVNNCNERVYYTPQYVLNKDFIINNGTEYPSNSCSNNIVKFSSSSLSSFGSGINSDVWWNCSFANRIVYEVNVSQDLVDYPLKIIINHTKYPSYLFAENGSDIRVLDSSLNELSYYLDNFDYNGTTVVYAKINLTANSSNIVYVYFGNANETSKSNLTNTFSKYMEVKNVVLPSQTSAGQWVLRVNFSKPMSSPVLVLGPDWTYNGGEEATIRVRNLNSSGFEAKQQEPSNRDDLHTTESFTYIVLPEGVYLTTNGYKLEARRLITSTASGGDIGSTNYDTISFTYNLSDPIVVSSVINYSSTNRIHTRQRSVGNTSFQISLEPQGNQGSTSVAQSLVGWIAIEKGYGFWDNKYYEVDKTPDSVTDTFYSIGFSNTYNSAGFVASMQTTDGGDSSILRGDALTNNSVQVRIQEDTTYDSETSHTTEVVGYFVFDEGIYPLSDYVENITINEKSSNITYNLTIVKPKENEKFDKNERFNITCSLEHLQCVGNCSNTTSTFIEFYNGSSWIKANSTTLLNISSNLFSTSLSCSSSKNISFSSSISKLNTSVLVRCMTQTADGAEIRSKELNITIPPPTLNFSNPVDLDIVYSGSLTIVNVDELFGKDDITNVKLKINSSLYQMNEYSANKWEYYWNIPSTYPEGLVELTAYGYNSTNSLIATEKINVFVKSSITCEWWNSSFNYKLPVVVKNPSSLNLTDFIFMLRLTTSEINYSLIQPNGEDIRVIDRLKNTPLNFWIEKWNDSSGESLIWVKLNLSPKSSTILDIYFNNETSVSSKSNKLSVFSYNYPRGIYFSMDKSSGNMNLTSYVNGNTIKISSTTLTLNRQQVVNTAYSIASMINATYPISGTLIGNNKDSIMPISFAGISFVYPFGARTGSTDQFVIYAPFNDSVVYIYSDNTLVTSATILAGTSSTITANIGDNQNAIIKASEPILVYHTTTSSVDSVIMYPASTELYGISSSGYVSAYSPNTRVEIYRSDGTSAVYTIQDTGILYVGGGGSQGTGTAIRLKANNPIGALQRADADGVEESSFLPLKELDTEYILPTTTQYIAIACPYNNTNISVYSPSGTFLNSVICTVPSPNYPGKAYFGSSSAGTATIVFDAGTLINATHPIYVYYESVDSGDTSGEESNILSHKQIRYYDPGVSYSFDNIVEKSSDLEVFPFFVKDTKKECEDINFSSMIVNRLVDVGQFNVSFYVIYGGSPYLIERKQVSSLSCGANITLNFSLNHTNKACGIGEKRLQVYADYENVINESDETNNVFYDDVNYEKAMEIDCKNSLEISINTSEILNIYSKIYDNSIYNITNISLNYTEGNPPLPSVCVQFNQTLFAEVENNSFVPYTFSINTSCAPENISTYGKIISDGFDYLGDHSLVKDVCEVVFLKSENATTVFGTDKIDFGIVEGGDNKELNLSIYNSDQNYNIINITFNFTNMYSPPSLNIVNKTNLSYRTNLPVLFNSTKNQTVILNLSESQIPGNYTGNVTISLLYDDNVSTFISVDLKTFVLVPYIYDIDMDGYNEWAFDYDNDGNPEGNSYTDNYNDSSPSLSLYNSTYMSANNRTSFLIEIDATLDPKYFWDPSYYGNSSGLVTEVNKTDSNNDNLVDFLIDNDNDGEYEKVYNRIKDFDVPDLVVENISVDPQISFKPQNITINVTINNSGGYPAYNFDVSLYINNSYIENITVSSLLSGEKKNVVFNYSNSNTGNFTIKIRVDVGEDIYENNDSRHGWDNSNNQLESWYFANFSHWHFVYGNITAFIVLGENNSIFYNWSWNGTGNVYVISQGTDIDFTQLQSLAKNATGQNSSNDFDEFDSVVGLNGFTDNTRNLYSIGDGTTAKNTTNITFYGINIENVTIYKSSPLKTDFYTGILWDMGDDTNGEYDPFDNEDVVLISPIMRNTNGSFGTYDYEIRIPEQFDTYKGGSAVEIWVEIE